MNRQPRMPARYHLVTLLLAYLLLPLVLAAPLVALVPGLGLGGGYFEMLACLTTTGATLFDRPQLLAEPLHLWRALVGWMGGLMVLVTAFAILAPLNLGGFEIGHLERQPAARRAAAAPSRRRTGASCARCARSRPIYAGLTAALALALFLAGDRAVRRRLPRHGDALDQRRLAGRRHRRRPVRSARRDRDRALPAARGLPPRLQLRGPPPAPARGSPTRRSSSCSITVLGVTAVLFLRSFVGAAEIDRQDNLARRDAGGLGQRLHRAVVPDHHRLREPRTGAPRSSGPTCPSPAPSSSASR